MKNYLEMYLEKAEAEIHKLIINETESAKLNETNERHLLLENRKHIKEFLCEMNTEKAGK